MNEEFNVGDIVTILLETGERRTMRIIQYPVPEVLGMVMNRGGETINNVRVQPNPQIARCEWFDTEGVRHERDFPLASLTRVENQEQ